jgi:quercetin dioxygenase-like cupin family protein
MEIRRFGPGHRRPDGPPGTSGISGQVIWDDDRANISELAFSRRALIAPHTNPNTTLFIVVSGGGWVQVGEERVPINHGEAVVWPGGVDHGAWTDGSEMRAIVVELNDTGRDTVVLEGWAASTAERLPDTADTADTADMSAAGSGRVADPSAAPPPVPPARPAVTRGEGRLADRPGRREEHDETEGEPW